MKVSDKTVKSLLEIYKEISLLNKILATLGWDTNVNLPPKASQGRASQVSYLTKIITEKWTDGKFIKLLEKANSQKSKLNLEEKAIIRNIKRGAKIYNKIPKEILVEESETTSKAFVTWKVAKENNDFAYFLPDLKKIIKLYQIIADHLGYKDNRYDALLDIYEPGLTTAFCRNLFSKLQPPLTQTLKAIQKSKVYKSSNNIINDSSYPIDDQRKMAAFVLKGIGYDFDAGRLDIAPHPFETQLGRFDIRITNRYKGNDFRESFTGSMHEGGHALYEQGIKEDYANTPLGGGVSLGIHESQSRFWENQVGRSFEFLKFLTPIFHALYPNSLPKIETEKLFAILNDVKPSLIRVEADEVTYNLHIALRFEIEEGLINGKIKPEDLPQIWKTKMKKYLGIIPETDKEGVLQDVHWSGGSFGYFPTYTLGNLYAAQFTHAMKKELNIKNLMTKGELGTILSWLRSNIHQYGSLYYPAELVKKVTGEKLNSKYFLNYIKEKYHAIYKIS